MAVKMRKSKAAKIQRREKIPAPPPAPAQPEPAKPAEGDTTAFIQRETERYDGDTAIKLYLREIGLVKLLTPQEEIVLAARIKKGDKKAREQMIKANLRLVDVRGGAKIANMLMRVVGRFGINTRQK